MGIVIRQSFYSSISAYIGVGIGYLNAIILMPLFMTPDEIGLMRAVMSIALLLTTFSSFGTGAMLIRYFPLMGATKEALKQLFTYSLIIIAFAFTFLALLLQVFSDQFFDFFAKKSPEVGKYLGLIIILIFQMTIFNLLEATLRSLRQIILPNVVRDLLYKSLHVVIILLYGFNFLDFDEYLTGHLFVYSLLILALLVPLIVRNNLGLDFRFQQLKGKMRDLMNYSTISIVSGLGMVIIIQVDQIMVTKYLGLTSNGVYTIALFMAAVIELPRKFVSQISTPILADSLAKNNHDQLEDHYKSASINQLIVGMLIFLLVAVNLDAIYSLMPNGDKYNSGWWVFIIIGVVKLVDMGFSLNGEIIGYSKYFKFNLYAILVLCVVAVISNILMIPRYGLYGAAFATLLSYVLFNLAKFVFIKRKFQFSPFSKNTLKMLLISLVVSVPFLLTPMMFHPLLDIVIRSGSLIAVFITLTYRLQVSNIFNEQLDIVLAGMKSKLP